MVSDLDRSDHMPERYLYTPVPASLGQLVSPHVQALIQVVVFVNKVQQRQPGVELDVLFRLAPDDEVPQHLRRQDFQHIADGYRDPCGR